MFGIFWNFQKKNVWNFSELKFFKNVWNFSEFSKNRLEFFRIFKKYLDFSEFSKNRLEFFGIFKNRLDFFGIFKKMFENVLDFFCYRTITATARRRGAPP